jgi:hypothetical protein
MELLGKFPLLEDLVLETHFSGSLSNFRNEGLRRIILRPRNLIYATQNQFEFPNCWKYFILHSHKVFPNVVS